LKIESLTAKRKLKLTKSTTLKVAFSYLALASSANAYQPQNPQIIKHPHPQESKN